jgi:uncharacterized protein (DUF736 family)
MVAGGAFTVPSDGGFAGAVCTLAVDLKRPGPPGHRDLQRQEPGFPRHGRRRRPGGGVEEDPKDDNEALSAWLDDPPFGNAITPP